MSGLQNRAAPHLEVSSGKISPGDGIGTECIKGGIQNLKALIARQSMRQCDCTFRCKVVPTNEKHGQMAISDEQMRE